MTNNISPSFSNINRIRVSDLCQGAVCFKRAKLQSMRDYEAGTVVNKYAAKGTQMHEEYSAPYKSFDRTLIRYKLYQAFGPTLVRAFDNIEVRGRPDDHRVLMKYPSKGKVVTVIEVKTTSRRYMTSDQLEAAKFQLQLYVWIMGPLLKNLGWNLHSRHWLEVYSQSDGHLMKRVMIQEDPMIVDRIKSIVYSWNGSRPMRYPSNRQVCRVCPKIYKNQCTFWKGP